MRTTGFLCAVAVALFLQTSKAEPLKGTAALTWEGDVASRMIEGIDGFLLKQIDASRERRGQFWKGEGAVEANRKRLAHILGVREARVAYDSPQLLATVKQDALVGRGEGYEVQAIRWPVVGNLWAEGLMLRPIGTIRADVVAIPDADVLPEQIAGLVEGVAPVSQYARRLAQSGCRVVVPVLVNRKLEKHGRVNLTNREWLYRQSFILGRHVIGYEVQKVLAAVDWLAKDGPGNVGVIGWGEGGVLAMHAAALDARIRAACVSGYFTNRDRVWQEPLDRNVFGLLERFGDAEVAALIAPRALIVEAAKGPEVTVAPGQGGGPGSLVTPDVREVRNEVERARAMAGQKGAVELVMSLEGTGPCGTAEALGMFLSALSPSATLDGSSIVPRTLGPGVDFAQRQERAIDEMERHIQAVLRDCAETRKAFLRRVDTKSVEKFVASTEEYRKFFYDEVIGRFDLPMRAANPRTRVAYEREKWTGYEVVLDVFDGVFAYGLLLVPKGMKDGERRAVVVCQHGLEGRPQDLVTPEKKAYANYAAVLADKGYVVFAPQNPYLLGDRFQTLQRKANPIGKSLFSIITPQHRQILDWLKTLPFVDGKRIAFYGLSYGGKTAMRVPALLTDYCLSICSGDFNEWVWKCSSTQCPMGYLWTGEYEIWEFDLGSTFNYAEMAALIAPRPFMVERGHFDGCSTDEAVAYEFAKVRNLYQAKLGIGDRCAIEWFVGGHQINGKGTYEFLEKWLEEGAK